MIQLILQVIYFFEVHFFSELLPDFHEKLLAIDGVQENIGNFICIMLKKTKMKIYVLVKVVIVSTGVLLKRLCLSLR